MFDILPERVPWFIVGERKDSQTYVRMKRKACDEVGIHSFHSELPETISEKELIDVVKGYNDNPDCHGILVQLPLPKHIDEEKVLGVISLEKDVDGFRFVPVVDGRQGPGHLARAGEVRRVAAGVGVRLL